MFIDFISILFGLTDKFMIRKILKVILYIVFAFFTIVLGLVTMWWINSPGEADPITDKSGRTISGSISIIDTLQIGGLKHIDTAMAFLNRFHCSTSFLKAKIYVSET